MNLVTFGHFIALDTSVLIPHYPPLWIKSRDMVRFYSGFPLVLRWFKGQTRWSWKIKSKLWILGLFSLFPGIGSGWQSCSTGTAGCLGCWLWLRVCSSSVVVAHPKMSPNCWHDSLCSAPLLRDWCRTEVEPGTMSHDNIIEPVPDTGISADLALLRNVLVTPNAY